MWIEVCIILSFLSLLACIGLLITFAALREVDPITNEVRYPWNFLYGAIGAFVLSIVLALISFG